jgi:CDP-glycerol glycerophosphotransferase (TagB/SpsB family)
MKGLVFVDDSELGMRFAVASAFVELSRRHSIRIVVVRTPPGSEQVGARYAQDGLKTIDIPQYEGRWLRWSELFDISCVRFRTLSPSFDERAKSFETNRKRYARLQHYARPEHYDAQRARVERDMGFHPEMLGLVLRERPDFFVIPSVLLDQHTDDAMLLAQAFRIPTAVLVSGWDNASSKGLLYHQPSIIGVWGEQSRKHVIDIQRVPAERVHVIGAPHYETFKQKVPEGPEALRARWGLPIDVPILLFAGTFRPFDETALLLELDERIESGLFPRVHVLYRPHPWRQRRDGEKNFLDCRWRHVTLDPSLRESYQQRELTRASPSASANFMSRMTHLRELYALTSAVVTPMSSVLLESMIAGLPVLALAFGDGRHVWSADRVSRMLHFRELYELDDVFVARERAEFFPAVERLLAKVGDMAHSARLRQAAQFFHAQDAEPYAMKVARLVDQMVEKEPAPRYDAASVRAGKTYKAETWFESSRPYRTARRALSRLRQLPSPRSTFTRVAALAKPGADAWKRGLLRAYRTSARDMVSTLAKLVRRERATSAGAAPSPPTEAFLRSREYAELMSRHLPVDGSHDLHEAQNETRNYRFRHHTVAHRLGVFRWRGIQKNIDALLPLLTAPGSKVVDFGGAGGPLGLGSDVVDRLSQDAWGRSVTYHSLSELGECVDVVFSSHALEHIPELDDVLRNMQRCLKPGGQLILHVPSFHCERWRAGVHSNARYNDHVWTFGLGQDPLGITCQNYVDIASKVGEFFSLRLAEYCGDDSILVLASKGGAGDRSPGT